jgi:hypothetical protein
VGAGSLKLLGEPKLPPKVLHVFFYYYGGLIVFVDLPVPSSR